MDTYKQAAPAYLSSEAGNITDDQAKPLPKKDPESTSSGNEDKPGKEEGQDWQHKLREEMGAMHEEKIQSEEKDITD